MYSSSHIVLLSLKGSHSKRRTVVPPSEYSTMACLLNGGTGLLVSKANLYLTSLLQSSQHDGNSQVPNATMVAESVPVPNSFAAAQEVAERESLQTRLVCLILYLDELKHKVFILCCAFPPGSLSL